MERMGVISEEEGVVSVSGHGNHQMGVAIGMGMAIRRGGLNGIGSGHVLSPFLSLSPGSARNC